MKPLILITFLCLITLMNSCGGRYQVRARNTHGPMVMRPVVEESVVSRTELHRWSHILGQTPGVVIVPVDLKKNVNLENIIIETHYSFLDSLSFLFPTGQRKTIDILSINQVRID